MGDADGQLRAAASLNWRGAAGHEVAALGRVASTVTHANTANQAMYEPRHKPPVPRAAFVNRILSHLGMAVGLLAVSLAIGMLGYMFFERLSWIDAFLNSAMLLGGMGPINPPQSTGGKLFAGVYALYAGLVFIVTAALIFAPLLHRLMHHFHWSEEI